MLFSSTRFLRGFQNLLLLSNKLKSFKLSFFHVVHDDDSRFGFVSVQEPVKGLFVLPPTVFPATFFFFCFNLVTNGLSSCIEDWCHILALVIVCLLKT